jgi:hypothetical protein
MTQAPLDPHLWMVQPVVPNSPQGGKECLSQ